MKKNIKHKEVKCNIKGCSDEARYWIPTKELSGDFDIKSKHTFYLCDNHCGDLSENGEYTTINFLNLENRKIRNIEVGIYSCNEDCIICN